jgi:hypothetical protein
MSVAVPHRWPVSQCDNPTDPNSFLWMEWYLSTTNMIKKHSSPGFVVWDKSCEGGVKAIPANFSLSPATLWRLIPTQGQIQGYPIFQVYNQGEGQMNIASYFNNQVLRDWYQVGTRNGSSAITVLGVTFDDVTTTNPQLWLCRGGIAVSRKMKWVVNFNGTSYRLDANFFTKPKRCDDHYIGGWQGTYTDPFVDDNDIPTVSFYALRPGSNGQPYEQIYGTYRDLWIPNPFFETSSTIPTCIVGTCNIDPTQPWNSACLEYIDKNPGDRTLALLLQPRCTSGTGYLDRVINDRLCSYWCRAGLPSSSTAGDVLVRAKCLEVRKSSCRRYYDDTTQGWAPGTTQDIIDKCACYMPDSFYQKLLLDKKETVPSGTTPLCYYQPCSDSGLGRDTYQLTDCAGVALCVQQGGSSHNGSCVIEGDPVTKDPNPVYVPPVVLPPQSGFSWWWLGLVLLVIISVGIAIYFLTRSPKPNTNVLPLILLASLSKKP